jgi:hypothetical protein
MTISRVPTNTARSADLILQVRKLEDYITFREAASMLGVHRNAFADMIWNRRLIDLDDLRSLHDPDEVAKGTKTTYVVRESAVLRLIRVRQIQAALASAKNSRTAA